MQLLPAPVADRPRLRLSLSVAVALYLGVLALWFLLYTLVGDASRLLFILDALGLYAFLPLPFLLLIALLAWNRLLIVGTLLAAAWFALTWGWLFWPGGEAAPEGPLLSVMAYNLLGFNPDPEGVVEALRDSDADIIGLSELNPEVSDAIAGELRDEYPYQVLEPRVGVRGSGVISRFPFDRVERNLDDAGWISPPTVLRVDFAGTPVLFVRVHSASGSGNFAARERQARLLADLARDEALPLIVAGDFNATDRNDSYAVLTEHMYDAWREAGSGFGNTFPGASKDDSPGSSRPRLLGIDVPQWLIRIDYVFCSYDWQPVAARIGPSDSNSDHRPVIAEVALRSEAYNGP